MEVLGYDVPEWDLNPVDSNNFNGDYLAGRFSVPETTRAETPTWTGGGQTIVPASNPGPSLSVGDVFGGVKATADSLLSTWGSIVQFQTAKDRMALDREVARGDIAVKSAQAGAAKDLALIQADTARSVEQSRAAAQVYKAQADANAAKNGTTLIPVPSITGNGATDRLIALVGLGLTVYALSRKGKK